MTLSPPLRKAVLALHLIVSIGWVGAVGAYIALDVATATGREPATLRAAYLGMDQIARNVIVPLALAALLTGVVVSLGTRSGLFRHYWVLISLMLTVFATVILLLEIRTITHLADAAADPTTSGQDLRALGSTLAHSIGGMVVLLT